MSLPALIVAALLAGLALGGAGAWQVQAWRWRAADAERLEVEREARRGAEARIDQAATRHEATRAQLQEQRAQLTEERERAIAAAPDWHAGQCWDDDGLRGIAAALGASAPRREPDAAVPAASAPD